MAKKDGPKGRRKPERVQYELTMSHEAMAAYLEELAGSLRAGAIKIGEGDRAFSSSVDGDIEIEVDARQGKRKARVELTLAFRAAGDAGQPADPAEPPLATIPDEMSF